MKAGKTKTRLIALYSIAGIALLALITVVVLWFNNELPHLLRWHFV